jgi:hypothetical protein
MLVSMLAEAKNTIDLRTIAEKTSWKQTGRADETARLCRNFQKKFHNSSIKYRDRRQF